MPLESTFLSSCYEYLFGGPPRPKFKPFVANRVDAHPGLMAWHEDLTKPKPTFKSKIFPLSKLPIRTRVRSLYPDSERWMNLHMDQTHAYYEEIDNIPAAAVGTKSPFDDKQWHIIHPLQGYQVRTLSTRVLQDLRKWIQESINVYVGEHKQVKAFVEARAETLETALKELARRGADKVGDGEGYLGAWDELDRGKDKSGDEDSIDIVEEPDSTGEAVLVEGVEEVEELVTFEGDQDGKERERLARQSKCFGADSGSFRDVDLN